MDSTATRMTNSILTAVPAVVGYLPTESVILLAVVHGPDGETVVGYPVVRTDLDGMLTDPAAAARALGSSLADVPVLQLWVVITTAGHVDYEPRLPFHDKVGTFRRCLADLGFPLIEAIFLPSFIPGVTWRCYGDPDHTGVLPDLSSSPATSAAVASGRTIASGRDELARRFTPASLDVRTSVRPFVIDTLDGIRTEILTRGIAALAARVTMVDEMVTRARTGQLPQDSGVIGALIATLMTPMLRETQLYHRSSEDVLALENLVLHLWRHASEPCSSALAGLVAVLAYLRGDGAWANIALATIDSPDEFTQLIGRAVGAAVPPDQLRVLSYEAAQSARSLLRLPPEPPIDDVHNG